jgi:hypothetical protein
MSSWIELCSWHETHELGDFPWPDWVRAVEPFIPMPLYDLSRILDAAAVYDMAMHAMHWQGGDDLRPVNMLPGLTHMLRGIGMTHPRQRLYMARALYAHCSRYVTGVPRIVDPPTYHLDELPVVPLRHVQALATATLTPAPAANLTYWLENVLMHGILFPLHVRTKFRTGRASARRGRKHSPALENRAVAEKAQHLTDDALAAIVALAPEHVPRLKCRVLSAGSGVLTLVLSAQPRAPSDE